MVQLIFKSVSNKWLLVTIVVLCVLFFVSITNVKDVIGAVVSYIPFINEKANYNVEYPSNWVVNQTSDGSYVRFENFDPDTDSSKDNDEYFKIEVVTLPNKEHLSLTEWVDKQNQTIPQPKILERNDMEISGYRAIYQLEHYAEYQHTSPAVFVEVDDKVLIINPSSATEDFMPTVESFLASLNIEE